MRGTKHILATDESGFTLVEIAVVAVIISILVLIVVGTQSASTALAEKVSCQANQRTIYGSLAAYREANGTYPTQVSDLVPYYLRGSAGTVCPTTENPYDYNPTTGRVWCPVHGL